MNEHEAMRRIEEILNEIDEPMPGIDEYALTGVMIVGLYSSLDSSRAWVRAKPLGGMDIYRQAGIFGHMSRNVCERIDAAARTDDDDD